MEKNHLHVAQKKKVLPYLLPVAGTCHTFFWQPAKWKRNAQTYNTWRTILMLCLVAFVFPSCKTQNMITMQKQEETNMNASNKAFVYNARYEYTLQKNDKVNISVWDNDDMSVGSIYGIYNSNEIYGKWLMLDAAGNVMVPKLGEINLLGLTVVQAKEKLQTGFKKWLVNPIIEVQVLNKEVSVLGELKLPGKFILDKDNNTLVDMIARAGDFDFYANKKKIQIVRMVNDKPVVVVVDLTKMDNYQTANVQIHPGDMVYVPSRNGKHWDRRAGSTIIPIASAISTIILIWGVLKR